MLIFRFRIEEDSKKHQEKTMAKRNNKKKKTNILKTKSDEICLGKRRLLSLKRRTPDNLR